MPCRMSKRHQLLLLATATATMTIAFSAVPGASAQAPEGAIPRSLLTAFRCADLEDVAGRLACFEEAVARIRTDIETGELVALSREQTATIQGDSFGLSVPSLEELIPQHGEPQSLEQIDAHVARVIARAHGRYSFVLDNGQTWRQVEAQRVGNIQMGDAISIRRGQVGNYLLVPARSGAAHRVRREE